MDQNTENQNISTKAIVLLSMLSLCFGWFSAANGSIILSFAVSVASFACLFSSLPNKKARVIAVLAFSGLLLVPSLYFGVPYFFTAVSILFVSVILAMGYISRIIKPDVVFIVTLILTFCFVAIGYAWVGSSLNPVSYNKDDVFSSISAYIEQFRSAFIGYYNQPEFTQFLGDSATELMQEVFDSLLKLSVAGVVILAFFVCGLCCKFFSFLWKRLHKDDSFVDIWRFTVPSSFAYFYIALFVLQFFVSDMDSTYSIVLMNLFLIFLVVFAYIGIRFLMFVISKRSRKKFLFTVLLFVGILFFNSVAIEILSLNGVLTVIIANRISDKFSGDI